MVVLDHRNESTGRSNLQHLTMLTFLSSHLIPPSSFALASLPLSLSFSFPSCLPSTPSSLTPYILLAGVQEDDIVLTSSQCSDCPFLLREAVVTEKLDGGNCSIFQGKVIVVFINLSFCTHGTT